MIETVSSNPRNPSALVKTRSRCEQKDDIPRTQKAYENLLEIDPELASAGSYMGCLYSDSEKVPQLAQKARELVSRDVHVSEKLGWLVHKRDACQQAINDVWERAEGLLENRALELSPEFSGANEARRILAELRRFPLLSSINQTGGRQLILGGLLLASFLSCRAPGHELTVDLLPPTSTNRIEAAATLPDNPKLTLHWQSSDPSRSLGRDVMEVWAHTPGRKPALVHAETFDVGDSVAVTVDLSEYTGVATLIRASNWLPKAKVHWQRAEIHGSSVHEDASTWRTSHTAEDPHILVVVMDALRADALGTYGGQGPTPYLDQLAAQGTVFENAYSTSSWTRPAVASLFTGLYASAHNVTSEEQVLSQEAFTFPERLLLRGYEVIGVHSNNHIHASHGFDQGFVFYGRPPLPRQQHVSDAMDPDARFDHTPAVDVYQMALDQLSDRADSERPVFLYLHTVDTHAPYRPAEWLLDEPRPTLNANPYLMNKINREGATLSVEQDLRLLYRGSVTYGDKAFGDFLDAVSRHLDLSRSVIVVTSDHGDALFDRDWPKVGHKGPTWEEQIRIPLILWGRDVPASRVYSEPVSIVDIAPTLLGCIDPALKHHGDFQGLDLFSEAETRFLDTRLIAAEQLSTGWQSFIQNEWKLTAHRGEGRYQLYNLRDDPLERHDLAKTEADIMERLLGHQAKWKSRSQTLSLNARERKQDTIPASVLQELRALGYLQ